MRNPILALSIIILFVALAACGQSPDTEKYDHSGKREAGIVDLSDSVRRQMPDFSLPSVVDGTVVTSKTFKGRVLLVTFFATWCKACIEEAATLEELQKEFASKEFSVIGLALDSGGSAGVAKIVHKIGLSYPVLMANDTIAGEFGPIATVSVSFLVDRIGNIRKKYIAHIEHENIKRDINALLSSR